MISYHLCRLFTYEIFFNFFSYAFYGHNYTSYTQFISACLHDKHKTSTGISFADSKDTTASGFPEYIEHSFSSQMTLWIWMKIWYILCDVCLNPHTLNSTSITQGLKFRGSLLAAIGFAGRPMGSGPSPVKFVTNFFLLN